MTSRGAGAAAMLSVLVAGCSAPQATVTYELGAGLPPPGAVTDVVDRDTSPAASDSAVDAVAAASTDLGLDVLRAARAGGARDVTEMPRGGGDGWAGVELPYSGESLFMLVLVPEGDIDDYLAELDATGLSAPTTRCRTAVSTCPCRSSRSSPRCR